MDEWMASGSGMPPDGELLGPGERRSLPPPPPSSSSGGRRPEPASERRNMTKSTPPSTSATRCSAPKITISSSSGVMGVRVPTHGRIQTRFRYHRQPPYGLHRDHHAFAHPPRARGLAF